MRGTERNSSASRPLGVLFSKGRFLALIDEGLEVIPRFIFMASTIRQASGCVDDDSYNPQWEQNKFEPRLSKIWLTFEIRGMNGWVSSCRLECTEQHQKKVIFPRAVTTSGVPMASYIYKRFRRLLSSVITNRLSDPFFILFYSCPCFFPPAT